MPLADGRAPAGRHSDRNPVTHADWQSRPASPEAGYKGSQGVLLGSKGVMSGGARVGMGEEDEEADGALQEGVRQRKAALMQKLGRVDNLLAQALPLQRGLAQTGRKALVGPLIEQVWYPVSVRCDVFSCVLTACRRPRHCPCGLGVCRHVRSMLIPCVPSAP